MARLSSGKTSVSKMFLPSSPPYFKGKVLGINSQQKLSPKSSYLPRHTNSLRNNNVYRLLSNIFIEQTAAAGSLQTKQ